MRRRDFVALPLFAAAPNAGQIPLERNLFLDITRGYLTATERTSPSLAVTEFPNATVTRNFLAKSGLSATAVTRMLPALAAWAASGRQPQSFPLAGPARPLIEILAVCLTHACDPSNPDYWQPAPADANNQRQVEASVVAWSVWLLRDHLLPRMTADARKNLAAWLASCTQRPVRFNNWAWFTAVNHAARLALSARWPEFQGDEQWMLEDLRYLDSLAEGDSGWYNDSPGGAHFDYYNSWVFASHFLYWNAMLGGRYPELRGRFAARLRKYLETAPSFFGADGAHVLYGRSLIYRFAVLTPLVLAYTQKLWPHSSALLKTLVRRNLAWHAAHGCFDASQGKLLETYTPTGSPGIKESYIDGGHPYWGMQAFALWLIPASDSFWRGPEEPLPVERADSRLPLPGPGLYLAGSKSTGHVRLYNARSNGLTPDYRDKYDKLSYSSAFGFCALPGRDTVPWDNCLVLRDRATGKTAGRGAITEHSLTPAGFTAVYELKLGGVSARIRTTVRPDGDWDTREHEITCGGAGLEGVELLEGASAVAGALPSGFAQPADGLLRHLPSGRTAGLWNLAGWDTRSIEPMDGHVLDATARVPTLRAAAVPGTRRLASLHYACPKPESNATIAQQVEKRRRS
jgi:hypothetical protein